MKKSHVTTIFVSLLMLFFMVPAAFAHRPAEGEADGATEIADPTTSFAFYRDFEAGTFFHRYTVEGEAGQEFHAGINIPQLEGLESYGVTLGIFGPGLPEINNEITSLPAAISETSLPAMGGIIATSEITADFYEPFTQTNYWGRQSLDITFPETGEYTLVIWQADEVPGKYVLDTGRAEVFTPGDIFRFPVWWWNTRAYFNQLPIFWLVSFSLIAVLALTWRLRGQLPVKIR